MTPRDWVERARRFYDDGLPAFDLPDDGRVLAVLEAAVAYHEAMDAWADCELGTEAEALADKRIGGAAAMLTLAVAALPGEGAP